MKRILYLAASALLFYCCAKKTSSSTANIRANPLPDSVKIYTLQPNEILPANSEFVRDIEMGTSLLSSECGYKKLMNYAQFTARQAGANLVQLIQVKKPTIENGCYQIRAKLYKNLEETNLTDFKNLRATANKSSLPKDADYAVIHFYRPKDYNGSAISYHIKMDGDSVIGKASNGATFDYKTSSFGKHKFTGKTQKQDAVTLQVEKGQEYYIRCGVAKGTAISLPDIYVMENFVGRQEYAELQ